jgi:hypothetical protein
MKPVMQTRFSAKDGSVKGNCFTACVASLLELTMEEMPDLNADKLQDGSWIHPFWELITNHGLEYYGTGTPNRHGSVKDYHGVDGYVIVCGKSPREWVKAGHAVVYLNGDLIHDPHPSGEGLVEVESWLLIEKE